MKLLSFQPFSLYKNGGGGRVLRRLYEGKESQVHSILVSGEPASPNIGSIPETIVSATPIHRPWMRWRLRNFSQWLRENAFKSVTENRIIEAGSKIEYDVLHVVNHGIFSNALTQNFLNKDKKLWVSFHDHYSTCSPFNDTQHLWNLANRRLVISDELGLEYQRVFGKKEYEVITDGVSEFEISNPSKVNNSPIIIYFAGLLHLDYLPLFKILADTLDVLCKQGFTFKLVLRGTQTVEFLNGRLFETEYRRDFIGDDQIKLELDAATILYLPIKFNLPEFYLYSLSTKMVSYLGGSGGILFHGPKDSAACNLLSSTQSAICCTSLDTKDLGNSIKTLLKNGTTDFSQNAKELAATRFNLSKIQSKFWQG